VRISFRLNPTRTLSSAVPWREDEAGVAGETRRAMMRARRGGGETASHTTPFAM
jgi:hypothetical protein